MLSMPPPRVSIAPDSLGDTIESINSSHSSYSSLREQLARVTIAINTPYILNESCLNEQPSRIWALTFFIFRVSCARYSSTKLTQFS